MADIPSWFLVVTGVVVAGASYYIGNSFRIFFYVGLVFFVYGIVKWLVLRGKRRVEKQ